MAHHHDHHDDTYYLDQLCLVALSAAFGGVCLTLYLWQTRMLDLMLGKQFHNFVGASGVVLVLLAVVRAASLWVAVGKQGAALQHSHAHDHGHEGCSHDHDHGACGHDHHHEHVQAGHTHDHHHEHVQAGPTHDHHHEHGHAHGHTHEASDHDHGWAPWRYVVLLIPIILFLLGLPNKGPTSQAAGTADFRTELVEVTTLVGRGQDVLHQFVTMAFVHLVEAAERPSPMSFKDLEALAADPEKRKEWQGKTVTVRGQYAPSGSGPRRFSLVRFRMQCCAADAVQYEVPIGAKEAITGFKRNDWIEVVGRVDFRQRGPESFFTILLVSDSRGVKGTDPDLNPYLQ